MRFLLMGEKGPAREDNADTLQSPGESQGGSPGEERAHLEARFTNLLNTIVPEEPGTRYSERWFLRRALSPYLNEYPVLGEDARILRRLRRLYKQPLPRPADKPGSGVYDDDVWAEEERDRQVRQVLDGTKRTETPDH